MTRRRRIAALFTPFALTLSVLAVAPPAAGADGLPILGVDANPVRALGQDVAYVTRRAEAGTRLAAIDPYTERPRRRVILPGRLSVPAVAYDATPSGLTADGSTLVLIQPRRRFPRANTRFALVDTATLRIRRRLALRGDFSFDALSPDGRLLYLIHYLLPRNPSRYEVRAYDLRRNRLLERVIVDPREPDERMSGLPVTRATGDGGRWEYTLYQGREYAFIHALDTEDAEAFCIDLDGLAAPRNGLWGVKLDLDGGALAVNAGRRRLATVDTDTLRAEIVRARPAAAVARGPEPDRPAGQGVPWLLIALPTLAMTVALALLSRQAARRSSPPATAGD